MFPGKKTSETCFKKLRTKKSLQQLVPPPKFAMKNEALSSSQFFLTVSLTRIATDQGRNKHGIAAKTEKTPLKSKGRKHVQHKAAKEKNEIRKFMQTFHIFLSL